MGMGSVSRDQGRSCGSGSRDTGGGRISLGRECVQVYGWEREGEEWPPQSASRQLPPMLRTGEPLERNYFRRGGAGARGRIYIGGIGSMARRGCWGRGSVGFLWEENDGCGNS